MAWNGSGAFTRALGSYSGANTWTQDSAVNTNIEAARHDLHDEVLAVGINACLAKNGENAATGNLNMGNNLHTNVADGSARNHYAAVGQVADSDLVYGGTSAGTNTITLSLTPAITAYSTGMRIIFLAGGANTAAATVNVNSVGAKDLQLLNGGTATALPAGAIAANRIVDMVYDGTRFLLLNPAIPYPTNQVFTTAYALGYSTSYQYIEAAGNARANGTAITATYANVGSADSTKGVVLPAATLGRTVVVMNASDNATLWVWANNDSDTINGKADSCFGLLEYSSVRFDCPYAATWFAYGYGALP